MLGQSTNPLVASNLLSQAGILTCSHPVFTPRSLTTLDLLGVRRPLHRVAILVYQNPDTVLM